jgi:hypothetical protein
MTIHRLSTSNLDLQIPEEEKKQFQEVTRGKRARKEKKRKTDRLLLLIGSIFYSEMPRQMRLHNRFVRKPLTTGCALNRKVVDQSNDGFLVSPGKRGAEKGVGNQREEVKGSENKPFQVVHVERRFDGPCPYALLVDLNN